MNRPDTHWIAPTGEPPFQHNGDRWQYVTCWHNGRQITGYLRAADDFVYSDLTSFELAS